MNHSLVFENSRCFGKSTIFGISLDPDSKALNLMKLVASHHSCAREIIHSMSLLLTYCTVPMGRRNTGQVKVTLQIMTKSIKSSKAMSIKSAPCVGTVVELIATWHRYDKKHGGRLLQIRKSLLTMLGAMSASKVFGF